MEIQREINGRKYIIELSDDELFKAYLEKKDEIMLDQIMQYLDQTERIGKYPGELLRSERFADKVLTQLKMVEDSYAENIGQAVAMAIDYEIKSNTMEDLVTASTADIIMYKLNAAGYQLSASGAELQAELSKNPNEILKSLKEAPAIAAAASGQKKMMESCISTVEKYTASAMIGRGINELGDHDDLIPDKGLDKDEQYQQPKKEIPLRPSPKLKR
ncbi:hypothetical protein SAMN02910447_03328 [Ruminococcus sp. YE71]|uniref:hypothetical protein n=1 Tax=unclassified Ruminococcus TaxID=2608920 RepID=UPI0008810CC4|nr:MULTISPECIES: hypothetical protein [unclassified Ruminococcus]SDA31072.1 hypothetical protein SAMN02910446_03397 [Ruminococcus sp. YE78]SFW50989.1 hypothetical protein SAMN02910447_03328 [Ruminococcus sp. YE71]